MKSLHLFTTLILLLSCNSGNDKNASSDTSFSKNSYTKDSIIGSGTFLSNQEVGYIKTRDRYIKYFKKLGTGIGSEMLERQNKDSLLVLEGLMREIMKDSKVGIGENNLSTLYEDMDFGSLDGLSMRHDSLIVFGTTKNLFFYYFMKNKINQLDQLTTKDLEKIFTRAFYSDEAIVSLATVQIPATNNIKAYGIAGVVTNGEAFGPPDHIAVLVANDKYIYLVVKNADTKMNEIKECREIWDSLILKPNKSDDEEEEVRDKYYSCYQDKIKSDSKFENIRKEMEDIVYYINH